MYASPYQDNKSISRTHMRQDNRIRLVHGTKGIVKQRRSIELQGLAGWLLGLLRNQRTLYAEQKRMQLVESLPMNGKRLLMLVSCEGEMFLVGGGIESIETIVPIKATGSQVMAKEADETCR